MQRVTWLLAPLVLLVSVVRPASAQSAEPTPPSDTQAAPSPPPPAPPTTTPPSAPVTQTTEAWPDSRDTDVRNETPGTESRWYGYQNLLVDLGGLAIAVGGGNANSDALLTLAVVVYLFGSPIVHWAHGNVAEGFASLVIRVIAPPIGAGLGCALYDSEGEWGCLGGFLIGGLVFGVAGMVVDYAVLAHEEVPREGPKLTGLRPRFSLATETGRLVPSVGVSGAF